MRYFWTKSFLVAALISCISSTALAGGWTVVKTSSGVQFTTDKKKWNAVTNGMTLPENSWINTGKRGRLTLQKETNVVNVNPGTLAGIIGLGGKLDKTVIAQQTGSVTLDLVRKSAPWMTVQTPFLAAVVKGTKFTVAVGRNEATVDVARGRVGVTDPRRGESVDIVSGQRARVDGSSRRKMEVKGEGKIEPVKAVKPTDTVVPMTTEQAKEVEAERKSASVEETNQNSNTPQDDTANENGNNSNENNNNSNNDNGNNDNGSDSANAGDEDLERKGSKWYDKFRKKQSASQREALDKAAAALKDYDISSLSDVDTTALRDLRESDLDELGDEATSLLSSSSASSSSSSKSDKLKKLLDANPKLKRWYESLMKYKKKKDDD